MVNKERGHRALAHTADVILEAWGRDLASCCEEAVAALAAIYVDSRRAQVVERRRVQLGPGAEETLLLGVLEEAIFTLDTADTVPVRAEVAVADGGLNLVLIMADRGSVVGTGAVPKAISRSDLRVESRPGHVWCRVLVDV
jgi:SHS2 domain-containing protein